MAFLRANVKNASSLRASGNIPGPWRLSRAGVEVRVREVGVGFVVFWVVLVAVEVG